MCSCLLLYWFIFTVLLTVGTFVAVGSRVKVKYCGSLCELEVVHVVIENGETVDESQVIDRLSSVHLSSEPDMHQRKLSQRFFCCINGTCVTLYKPPSAERGNIRPAITLDDVGGVDSQRDFLTRLVSSMLDVERANAIKQSGKL